MTNPLLLEQDLPAFADIRPEHVSPAVDELLAAADTALERAVGPEVPADYDAMSAVLDVTTERLGRSWGAVGHLNAVADTPELRAAYNDNLPKVTELHTRLGLPIVMLGFTNPDDNAHAPNETMVLLNYETGLRTITRLWDDLGKMSPLGNLIGGTTA